MKNKRVRNGFSFISCFFILVLLFVFLSAVVSPKGTKESTATMNTYSQPFLAEDKNSIDVIAFGDSTIYRGFIPNKLWNDYKITSCNLAAPSMDIIEGYYYLQKMFKHQNPKLLIIDADMLFTTVNEFDENGELINSDSEYYKDNYDKYYSRQIKDRINLVDDAIYTYVNYLSPLMKYKYNWKSLTLDSFNVLSYFESKDFITKGYFYSNDIKPFEYGNSYMSDKDVEAANFNQDVEVYFEKIVKLCKKNNTQIALVSIPIGHSWNWSKHYAVENLAKQYNLKYIDYNADIEVLEEFDWTKNTIDAGMHLNYDGAVKFMNSYEEIIVDYYGIEKSKITEEQTNNWDEDTRLFYSKIVDNSSVGE